MWSGPIMHPTTCGQLHSYRRNARGSSGIFEPLFCHHDYLDPATHLHVFCVSSFKFSARKLWLDQPGSSLVLLGSGSSLVQSGTCPLPRGYEQRHQDGTHARDAVLVVAAVFCWQFCQLPVIWVLKGPTSPWNRYFPFSKISIFIEIGYVMVYHNYLLTVWPWEENVVGFISTAP